MEEERIPGAAIVVVRGGKTLYRQGFGVEDIREDRPVEVDHTIFRIGSISKPMTYWALARLVDLGVVSYDDPVSKFVPEVDDALNVSGSEEPILIRHILTVTPGFDQIGTGRHVRDYEKPFEERLEQRISIEDFLLKGALRRTSAPGTHFRYETYGSTLAGLILMRITGESYAEAMRTILFDPAGLKGARVLARASNPDRLAVGHGYLTDQEVYGITPTEIYSTQPASSIDMTPADMERLMQAVTSPSSDLSLNPFSPRMRRALLSPQFQPAPGFSGATHGMHEFARAGGRDGPLVQGIGHGGTMWGFQSSLMFLPDNNLGIFVVANRNAEGGGGPVTLDRQVIAAIVELIAPDAPILYPEQERLTNLDLSPFAGRYAYNIYCKTCSEAEFEAGAWRASSFLEIEPAGDHILVRGVKYFPVGDATFLAEDRRNKLHFIIDKDGKAQHVSFATSPDTFDRME